MSKKQTTHSCAVNGFTHVKAWILPERKKRFKIYCKQNGLTMSEAINRFINSQIAGLPSDDLTAD